MMLYIIAFAMMMMCVKVSTKKKNLQQQQPKKINKYKSAIPKKKPNLFDCCLLLYRSAMIGTYCLDDW